MEYKILIQGYTYEEGDVEHVSCTSTLIRDNGKIVVVDPGTHREKMREALAKEGLKFEDVDYVVLTHMHDDHCLLTALFSNAKVVDTWCIYSFDGTSIDREDKVPGTSIEIISLPGHAHGHICLVLDNNVVVAGDVIWWADDEEQKTDYDSIINKKDPYCEDFEKLKESRKKLLEIADFVIPGHGRAFNVEK